MNTVSDYFKRAIWGSLVIMVSPEHIIIIIFDHGYKAYILGTCVHMPIKNLDTYPSGVQHMSAHACER